MKILLMKISVSACALENSSNVAHICITDVTSLISFLLNLFHYCAAFLEIPLQIYFFLLIIFRLGLFGAAHGSGYVNAPLPKICHTYPTMMKLSMVILCLKKIQNIYKSRDTTIKFG